MKLIKTYLFLLVVFTSCNQEKQEVKTSISNNEIIIPTLEKNKTDINFKLENGILLYENKPFSGIVNEFHLNDSLKTTSQYYQGKRQGYFRGFYDNGKKTFERLYTNGLKSGNHKGWFKNGNLMFDYQFNNLGSYHGEVKDWFENGNLQKHFNFVEGKEFGSQKMWDVKGKIIANFHTVNGERHGLIGLKKCISVKTKKNETI